MGLREASMSKTSFPMKGGLNKDSDSDSEISTSHSASKKSPGFLKKIIETSFTQILILKMLEMPAQYMYSLQGCAFLTDLKC